MSTVSNIGRTGCTPRRVAGIPPRQSIRQTGCCRHMSTTLHWTDSLHHGFLPTALHGALLDGLAGLLALWPTPLHDAPPPSLLCVTPPPTSKRLSFLMASNTGSSFRPHLYARHTSPRRLSTWTDDLAWRRANHTTASDGKILLLGGSDEAPHNDAPRKSGQRKSRVWPKGKAITERRKEPKNTKKQHQKGHHSKWQGRPHHTPSHVPEPHTMHHKQAMPNPT
mmetsp:Transcript_4455/g.11528  ORF Transcript_4455/g.11528 Transcript_4455/m.11528 type:complete len:223 (-) Transcript_4455:8-676(-)